VVPAQPLPDHGALTASMPAGLPAALPAQRATELPTELPTDLGSHLEAIERRVLMAALERHHFNRTAAGASLGLTLRQIRYRMARLGILVGGEAPAGEDEDER
jgi:two-component system response regulator PilR (NtrC family)